MRISLAQALCGRPDILLLDEPTNHLDLHGVLWLQDHLASEWGANSNCIVVIVSHDRSFIDNCVTDIIEIYNCKLRSIPGNYSQYLDRIADEQRCMVLQKEAAEKEERTALKDLSAMKKKAREHKDEKMVRQLKSKEKKLIASGTCRANGGVFKLSSNRDKAEGGADRALDLMSKLREDSDLRFTFHEVDCEMGQDLKQIDDATIRLGRTDILRRVTLTLDARTRVAIVGANGVGKSTLMKALSGELKLDEGPKGRGRTHPSWDPAFVSQNHLENQGRHLHWNCVDFLRSHLPDKDRVRGDCMTKQSDESVLRAHLGKFGLGNDALKKLGHLSGGQRARLSLATVTVTYPSVLLLDEPTNHLDMDSLDALALGLQAFEGAVVVVSHNRGFLEALCDELWIVQAGNGGQPGTVKKCPRGEEAFAAYFAEYAKEVRASLK